MSGENITILEGGKAENFGQVTKLKTSNGSGNDLWVPKTDVKTGHLSVKKNGLYYTNQYEPTASEKKDGKFYDIYGWDTITVSVKKKAKGKKKKGDKDVHISVEADDNGNLIETEDLPSYISIKTLPEQIAYFDGEPIYLDGIVVKAYFEDGEEWGAVPLNELIPNPAKAKFDESQELGFDADSDWLVYDDGTYLGDAWLRGSSVDYWRRNYHKIGNGKAIVFFRQWLPPARSYIGPVLLSLFSDDVMYHVAGDINEDCTYTSTVEIDGYTWYVGARYPVQTWGGTPMSIVPDWMHELPTVDNVVELALEASHAKPYGGDTSKQTIQVRWDRGDGIILTDSFDITVTP